MDVAIYYMRPKNLLYLKNEFRINFLHAECEAIIFY